ncbi:hypothetical protein [Crossiella sp. CA198]|uniref:hypothetical protein n=1 Tax=Crossiella sp. CA198 TaxID=3455607 RepID=UPI003F8D34C6
MRKPNKILLTALTAVCLLAAGAQLSATAEPSEAGTLVNTYRDASGKVTVTVYERASAVAAHIRDHRVTIPDADVVAVGGGAVATNQGNGALLTASYPLPGFTGWAASSKDHHGSQPHSLRGYVIGLRIAGMSAEALRAQLRVTEATSAVAGHPEAEAPNPGADSWALLGGGFNLQWTGAGNLATASFPTGGETWKARGKDHNQGDPAKVVAYGVYLNRNLPAGRVSGSVLPGGSAFTNHPGATATLAEGFALTGGGAEVHWQGAGNLLWQLTPVAGSSRAYRAGSKDHGGASPAALTAYAVGIRLS